LRPKLNGVRAMLRARQRISPVSYEELIAITDDWVDAAFQLQEKDLAYMERLVLLQSKRARQCALGENKTAGPSPAQSRPHFEASHEACEHATTE
jgi:hypothetical protein